MHRFVPHADGQWDGCRLQAGAEYLVEDATAGELLIRGMGGAWCAEPEWRFCDGHGLLVVRPGGYGDLLFLTAVLAAVHRSRPELSVGLCCYGRYRPAVAALPWLERVDYPLDLGEARGWGQLVWLEGAIESDPAAHERHIIDQFAARFPFPVETADKTLHYRVTELEAAEAICRFPRGQRKRVAVQLTASARCRTYPPSLLSDVFLLLDKAGAEVVMLGEPGSTRKGQPSNFLNLPAESPALSFRESVAVMAQCDVLIAPDSAMAHVAAAIGLPCVALYGPFPGRVRTAPYPTTVTLEGRAPCAPCFHHVRPAPFPEGKVCETSGWCAALAELAPERIVRKALEVAR